MNETLGVCVFANMKTTHVIFLGVACISWASCARNGEPGPDAVVVRVLDTPLPPDEWGRSNFLWDGFANKPHEAQFDAYTTTTEKWKETYGAFAAALVRKAEDRELDASSLRKALDLVLADSKDKVSYLPTGAYQTTMDGRLVWIVVVKWEYARWRNATSEGWYLLHIRAFVYDQETLQRVGFMTCD